MSKYGYIIVRPGGGKADIEEDISRMQELGCELIVQEQASGAPGRAWESLLAKLKKGDEVFIQRLSDVIRGKRQLAFFVEFCQRKDVRLVAVRDRIDTADRLFPEAKTLDILRALSGISKKQLGSAPRRIVLKAMKPGTTKKSIAKAERDKMMVNMYKQGYSIEEIHRASGLRSRSSVFRLLGANGVELNRASSRNQQDKSKRESLQEFPIEEENQ